MSYAPKSLRRLRTYLVAATGNREPGNFGISSGSGGRPGSDYGYHRGKDLIYGRYGRKGDDYSVMTTRDRAGLSDAAMGIDIKLGNAKLQAMSKWLVRQCQARAAGSRDIREVIYSPDGKTVMRYDRARGAASQPRAGEADATHLWHTHIGYYRDSEERDKVALFEGFFGPLKPEPPDPPEPPPIDPPEPPTPEPPTPEEVAYAKGYTEGYDDGLAAFEPVGETLYMSASEGDAP